MDTVHSRTRGQRGRSRLAAGGPAADLRVRWSRVAYPATSTVVIAAAVAVLASTGLAAQVNLPSPALSFVAVIGAALVCCGLTAVRVRIRAAHRCSTMTDAVILVGCVLLPGAWLVLLVGAGVLLGSLLRPPWGLEQVLTVARDVLCAAAAVWVAATTGVLDRFPVPRGHAGGLVLVALSVIAVENLISLAVLGAATGLPPARLARVGGQLWYPTQAVRMTLSVVAMVLTPADLRVVLALMVLLVAVHLTMAGRLRERSEQIVWQRLAEACDELAHGDLERVVSGVVVRLAALFSADEVELELGQTHPAHRLIRGGAGGLIYDGPVAIAPHRRGYLIYGAATPDAGTGSARIGLRFRRRVQLSHREGYALRALNAALDTAERNALAVQAAATLTADHARGAGYSPLTGLANRGRLFRQGAQLLAAKPAAWTGMILIDLDGFKEINDELGHATGDRLLAEVGRRLSAAAGPEDLVAHLGEDEFAVLLAGLPDPAGATARARALLSTFCGTVHLGDVALAVSASAGIALLGGDGVEVEELLRRADIAMHQAKREGDPVVLYQRHRDTADRGRLMLTADLSRAVSAREFEASFQPIVDLRTGQVIATEALARWRHPDRGALQPRRFLASVERSALLPAFSVAVLQDALRGAAAWRRAGFDLPVAVNVSPRSLIDPSFPEMVEACLSAAGLPSSALVLEVTESVTLSHLEVVDEVLGALAGAGVRVALDDFGTGYSSLATLARVPVDELKIDRSFVACMHKPTQAAVVRSTIDLGRRLGLLVVAEGVETEQQSSSLWQWGCQAGQGHLFAQPMALAQLIEALRTGYGGRPGCLAAAREGRISPR